jgi:hypothetical protein
MKPNAIDERFVADLLNPTHPTVVAVAAQQVSEKLAGLAAFGVTVVCQPVGSDIARAAPSCFDFPPAPGYLNSSIEPSSGFFNSGVGGNSGFANNGAGLAGWFNSNSPGLSGGRAFRTTAA